MPSSAAPGSTNARLPVASKAKDYTDRPDEVMAELDDLRTRSIAKVLNKHFTDTTKQLAKEKALADAALADLERRRAQTKEFVPSKGGGGLNPYDQLYMQLMKKKSETKRKERETLLLYQRYVMKYGKSAKTASPLKAVVEAERAADTSAAPAATLDTLDENKEIYFSDETPKKAGGRSKEQQENQQKQEAARVNHFMSALNKFMTDDQMNAISQMEEEFACENDVPFQASGVTDEGLTSTGATLMTPTRETGPTEQEFKPSPAPEVKTFLSAMSNFMTPEESDDVGATEEEMEDDKESVKDNFMEDMSEAVITAEEPKTVDAILGSSSCHLEPTDTSATTTDCELGDADPNDSDIIMPSNPAASPVPVKELPVEHAPPKRDCDETEDQEIGNDDSYIEKEVPPKTPDRTTKETSELSTPTACTTPPDDAHQAETPSFATSAVDDDVDERSIISGLTSVNSALTRQVLDEIEEEMEDFIKTETAAIRKVLDTEEEELSASNHGSFGNSSSSLLGDESVQVAMKAEAMAREMQKILDQFSNEDSSVPGSGEKVDGEDNEKSETKKYPYKFEPAIPGQDWYVYYDDNYKRDFFLEKKTNRTQWDYPTSVPTSRMEQPISSNDFLSDIQSVASSRGGSTSRRSSRRSLFRRQRRKRRTQRLLLSFFTLFCVLAAVFHWRVRYPDKTFSGAMAATLSSFKVDDTMTYLKDQFEYTFTDRRQREEKEEEERIFLKAQRERQARELSARRAKEEAARKAKEEAERKAKEEAEKKAKLKSARDEAARLDTELRLVEEEERLSLAKKLENESRRPWVCNIPFAYFIPRCNRLADVKPLFQESDFVFLQ